MAKKMDIEIMVDATEDLGLEATGRYNGTKFLGKITNKGIKLLTKEVGKAIVEAMGKTSKDNAEESDITEVVEDVTTEEVIENIIDEEV